MSVDTGYGELMLLSNNLQPSDTLRLYRIYSGCTWYRVDLLGHSRASQ
jgi:hypothetical protein